VHRSLSRAASAAGRVHPVRGAITAPRTGWVALLLATAPAVAMAQGGATVAPARLASFANHAVVTYTYITGAADSSLADATVSVMHQAGVSITGPFASTAAPGDVRSFLHAVTNRGNEDDAVQLAGTAPAGWTLSFYRDVDGDGQRSAADVPITGPLPIARGGSTSVLAVYVVPAAAIDGSIATLAITATSASDARAAVATTDRVTVAVAVLPRPSLTLQKLVDRSEATIGDTLRYTIRWTNAGDGDATAAIALDTLPGNARYVPGSLVLDGAPLTDAADADAGTTSVAADGRAIVRVTPGVVAPGRTGTLTLRAVVAPGAPDGVLSNVGAMRYGNAAGTVALTAAASVGTRISSAVMAISERIVGVTRVNVGTAVHFRITYSNVSATDATNAVVHDTLPASLAFVSSTGATVNGAELSWPLGTLKAGASGVIDLYTTIVSRPPGDSLSDRTSITADNAAARRANALVSVTPFAGNELAITKTAAVLEAAVGDAIPYTVTVRNTGSTTLRALVVHDLLPGGMLYSPSRSAVVDSVSVNGADLAFHLAGALAPGASIAVRYAAVVATPAAGADLRNSAWAEAEGGLVHSDTAVAVVTPRRSFALRERTLIGKVWLDRNADGVQQAGEEGLAGVQVWDASGEVVTTDREGRYSFRNFATGTHALRLDPLAIPRDFVFPSSADEVVVVQADGWTMPRTSIRLVPRAGAVVATTCGCTTPAVGAIPVATLAANRPPAIATDSVVAAPLTVAPMHTAAERAQQTRSEVVTGPVPHFSAPLDGSVITTTRFYAGVRGLPGTPVRLYDGARFLRDGTLRVDGTQDFINVELAAGPHHLRVVTGTADSLGVADSIAVHVSGAPSRFVTPAEPPTLRGDAPHAVPVRVRVLDQWGVPVAGSPMITVEATGARVDAPDADASSMGLQLRTDAQGWLTVPLVAGYQVGAGAVRLTADKARGAIPLRIFASVRSLLATGIGQVGVGAAPGAFGALTLQGALTEQTSVSMSYDSRRTDAQFFQQGYDPLGDDRFLTFGDNSRSRIVAPSSRALSARVDHGMDWIAAGDVQTEGFGRDGELGAYRRAVTGASAQLTTGALTWHSFGSMTHQALERRQLRADGSTGPYLLGSDIRAGTEQLAIEVRAVENAARVVVRQVLTRTTDYQIDYTTGVVLLRLPVPSADPSGNPVFVVATVERNTAGLAHFVGGARVDADAVKLLRISSSVLDTLTIGLSGIRDGASATPALAGVPAATHLFNADVRMSRGRLQLRGGMLRAQSPDSAGTALSATTRWALPDDRFALDGHWMKVGEGLGAADPRLASALDEVSVGVSAKLAGAGILRLHHDRTHFSQFGADRSASGITGEQSIGGRRITQDIALVAESLAGTMGTASAVTARVNTQVTSRVDTWVSGSHTLATPLNGVAASRPDQVGTGITLRLPLGLRLEAAHRISRGLDSAATSVTSGQLRAEGILGGALWTGFESSTGSSDEVRAAHSALFGWNQRHALGAGWQVTSMFERRVGLSRASLIDPARALPFAQPEVDRWSAGAGLGWNPAGDQARFALNSEVQRSVNSQSMRFQVTGDAAINAGMALITLHDWANGRDASRTDGLGTRVDERSLLGLALRPVTSERFNALAKIEWRRSVNAAGDVLRASNTQAQRLIGTTDAVWAPLSGLELNGRYALRLATTSVAGDSAQRVRTADHFGGARLDRRLGRGFSVRADGRLLMETNSGLLLWNAAPSAVYDFQGRIQLEGGYRFGALRDPDFANVGGAGAFATAGFRLTEQTLSNPAAFWRARVANDR
jgi:uncharacterized repeat protein (TIGR01451 family)